MEIIQFDISGKFAHFRKYYANNTALTYSLPPRTTVMGILAAILGRSRDSYYEEFSSDKILIGIAIKTPIKKKIKGIFDTTRPTEIPQIELSSSPSPVSKYKK